MGPDEPIGERRRISLDRDLGEIVGTVHGMTQRLASLESGLGERITSLERAMRDGFRDTQTRIETQANEFKKRLEVLERFRWQIGGIILSVGVIYSVGLAAIAWFRR